MSNDPDTDGALSGALAAKKQTNADTSAANRGALTDGEEVKINLRAPENLREAFQGVCAKEGRSMSWVIRQWMLQAVENGETGL